jgi:hypothetical protein
MDLYVVNKAKNLMAQWRQGVRNRRDVLRRRFVDRMAQPHLATE